MNLALLNPLLLFGLTAVILPILIHRITRKNITVRSFSAVRLLLQSRQIAARPRRLRHLLLLALRILAVATIVFMAARPALTGPGFAALPAEGATILILDNSLSMGYLEGEGRRRYDAAKRAAKEALEGFAGRVAVVTTAGNERRGRGLQWMKPDEALRAVEAIPLSFGRGNLASALASAYRELKRLEVKSQILVLTDMARGDWEGLDPAGLGTVPETGLTFLSPTFAIRGGKIFKCLKFKDKF